MNINFIPVSLIDDYKNNSNTHPEIQIDQIESLLGEVGWTMSILVEKKAGRYALIAGHGRKEAAVERFYKKGKSLRMADKTAIPFETIPAVLADGWTQEQVRMYVIADNRVAKNSFFDEDVLANEIAALEELGVDIGMLGFDDCELEKLLNRMTESANKENDGCDGMPNVPRVSLSDKFMIPPFSVFNAREGWWTNSRRY